MLDRQIKIQPSFFKDGCLGDLKNINYLVNRAYFGLAFTEDTQKKILLGEITSCEVLIQFKESLDLKVNDFEFSVIDIDELIKFIWVQIYQHHQSMSRTTFNNMNTVYFDEHKMTPYHRDKLIKEVCKIA